MLDHIRQKQRFSNNNNNKNTTGWGLLLLWEITSANILERLKVSKNRQTKN